MGTWHTLLGLLALAGYAFGEALTPPYFNLAFGRKIKATSTCGEGVDGPELYCTLVGANADRDINNIIQGQVCDICDATREDKKHPAEYAIDGAETWWQSPPLSRNMRLNEVNLTIDFGQAFHVAYVYIKMANSPRPGVWALEKSVDSGETFTPWQYFADSPAECEHYFGKDSVKPITEDDSVICDSQFSNVVPLEGGEIVVSMLNNRPSASDFFKSTVLQDWTRATNLRLRLIRTKTLLGHLMSVARQDTTVTRRYFYSIKDMSIGGRCMCNGHADSCDNTDPSDIYKLVCRCQHHTYGDGCELCEPGYRQRAWQQSKANELFVCEQCNCHKHSDECEYSEEVDKQNLSIDMHGNYAGGGVCKNCRHNTEGINCDKCISKYYRPRHRALNATDVCEPCDCEIFFSTGNCSNGDGKCECREEYEKPNCDSCSYGHFGFPDCRPCECNQNGTRNHMCDSRGGACKCLHNYGGHYCKECAEKYYSYPQCLPCECNSIGSFSEFCNATSGHCDCKNNFGGRSCDRCAYGFFNYPTCSYCNCDNLGSVKEICDASNGQCLCKEGYGGPRCDQCIPGYYGYPQCRPCNCSETGSSSHVCDSSGKCPCLGSFSGKICDSCSPGHFQYPQCISCNCNERGAIGISCDADGICQCRSNFNGDKCTSCKTGFYNFPLCEECNCDPAGTSAGFMGCGSVPIGELCQCKPRVHGRICNQCKPNFWNLLISNPEGCSECNCNAAGVIGNIMECDQTSGQCACKPDVESQKCDVCKNEFYGLKDNDLFGCSPCQCDIGGAEDNICDKVGGQCQCHPRVSGRDCREPLEVHYFPSLYSQLLFEAEDGYTPDKIPVRYDFLEEYFPGYSWKGYAVFLHLQSEILHDIFLSKPSEYRIILRYVNLSNATATGIIKAVPESNQEVLQTFPIILKPSKDPAFVTIAVPLVMNTASAWTIRIAINGEILLDYFVLLPAAFYEATILKKRVEKPCLGDESSPTLCRHFSYPPLRYDRAGPDAFFVSEEKLPARELYTNPTHLEKLSLGELPSLTENQPELSADLRIEKLGRYILVVNYATPVPEHRSFPVNVEVKPGNENQGRLHLTPCPYDLPCRQAIVDSEGRIKVYNIEDEFSVITFKTAPEWKANVALIDVIAVPVDDWSIDYIRPSPVCVKKDGTCIPTSFPTAFDSTKIEFEVFAPNEVSLLPETVADNKTSVVELQSNAGNITINGTVSNPGDYIIVVHYFQPFYPKFKVSAEVASNGQKQGADLEVLHCPAVGGCRAALSEVINKAKPTHTFYLNGNFSITLVAPHHQSMYLDNILVASDMQYSSNILEELSLDQSELFIEECGQNHFNIDVNSTGFCRDATYSLTMEHYVGALKCECSYEGSLTFICARFGGQCPCRENVIGRRCETCRSGYFGFPNCKPCACPSGICDPQTGDCVCPSHVIGEFCNQCEEQTFGFDRILGCLPCNCDPTGVERNNMECDPNYGTCSCKSNVVGRTCDKCAPGNYYFPQCEACACDLRGTTSEICNQHDASCYCKPNVHGQACDLCKEGTFHISEVNPKGCTDCFCFGKSTRCSSSNLYLSQLKGLDGWQLAALDTRKGQVEVTLFEEPPELIQDGSETVLGADFTVNDARDAVVYFVAPNSYLGNKLTSYGSNLSFTIFYTSGTFGSAVSGPDVALHGADTFLLYHSLEQPAASEPYQFNLLLVENNFRLPTGFPATREQIMQVLQSLSAIYIRATYWESSVTTRLSNVSLDIATADFDPEAFHALAVEQCQCPPNYQGLSCEECAPGFYRTETGPFGGYCVPCKCNGHSEDCDSKTGKCFDCKDNTYGDHCEFCETGYHGNATFGNPYDCLICACPIPLASNNFATSCDVSSDGDRISCLCKPGYYGARCESCAAGHYGEPEVLGDTCKPCNCSGNIDVNDPSACNSINGNCDKCLNNTFGDICNLCKPFHYGDAVLRKDCKGCDCNKCGSLSCESHTGQCICQDNVVGETCNRCAPNHYDYKSCAGCKSCECGLASKGPDCHDESGQCSCQPGVTGRKCDKCAPGFWNYTENGCLSCGCNTEFSVGVGCNPATGQCECLPGVIGERCDHCPHRWVLKPDEGCFDCDTCTHDLLDTTDQLKDLIDNINDDLGSFAGGYFTLQRLKHINDSAVGLLDKVSLLEPNKFDIQQIQDPVNELEGNVRSLNRQADFAKERSENMAKASEKVRLEAFDLEEMVRDAADKTGNTVFEVDALASSLDGSAGSQVEQSVDEAEVIVDELRRKSLSSYLEKAKNELLNDTEVKNLLTIDSAPVEEHAMNVIEFKKMLKDFDNKIDDLKNHSELAQATVIRAKVINDATRKAKLSSKVHTVNSVTKEAEEAIKETKTLLNNATTAVEDSRAATSEIANKRTNRISARDNFNFSVVEQSDELNNLVEPVRLAKVHAEDLARRAKTLNDSLAESRHFSGSSVQAARAYADIADDIAESKNLTDDAGILAEKAAESSAGLDEKANESLEKSIKLLEDAKNATALVLNDLKTQLDKAKARVNSINENTIEAFGINKNIERELEKSDLIENLSEANSQAILKSDSANTTTLEKIADISSIIVKIPDGVDTAKKLPKDAGAIQLEISQARDELDRVNRILPDIERLMDNLNGTKQKLDDSHIHMDKQIERLKRQVAEARDLASRIKVGVTFMSNTYIEIKNPDDLKTQSTSTKVSGYFKTQQENGAILYLGNEIGTSRKLSRTLTDDFLSVELENGHPVVSVDLGSGPHRINSDVRVKRETWYQFIVERTGKHLKLTIREDVGNGKIISHEKEEVIPGSASILNLDNEESKIYVGGTPPHAKIQSAVKYNSFFGQMEGLVIGDNPISLWNFKEAANNAGALERDRLVNSQQSTGYRFNGDGYAALNSSSYRMDVRTSVILRFKTTALNGLLFLAGKDSSFISLELQDGFVVYKYNLGDETAVLRSSVSLNDNNWHSVEGVRYDNQGVLKINDEQDALANPTGSGSILYVTDTMYFGGFPGDHAYKEVTNVDFDGCIDGIIVDGIPVDLSKHINAFGVSPGCPNKFATSVSFLKSNPGHITWTNASATNSIDLSLRFKTSYSDGAIVVVNTRNQSNPFSIALVDGSLVVQSNDERLSTAATPRYDDDQWHVITVTHDERSLKISVDDFETLLNTNVSPPKPFRYANVWVGGLPSSFSGNPDTIGTIEGFRGCIADVAFNGALINFANSSESHEAIVGKCTSPDSIKVDHPDVIGPTKPREPKVVKPVTTTSTTTPKPVTTTTPVPTPAGLCALPFNPISDSGATFKENGWRFGTANGSRIEFRKLPQKPFKSFKFSFKFKTSYQEGIIFYASKNQSDQIGLFLRDGQVHFLFNMGSGEKILMHTERYDDGQWHTVEIGAENNLGRLVIDTMQVAEGASPGTTVELNLSPPYYVGGLNPEHAENVSSYLKIGQSLEGCIRDIKMNGRSFSPPSLAVGVQPCSDNTEPGVFFHSDGGYVKLFDMFVVGSKIDIKMEVKPRFTSGVLLSVHGKKDYLLLYMDDGAISFTVDSGKGPITSTYKPPENNKYFFCDGGWHTIHALKTKNVVALSVNFVSVTPGTGPLTSVTTRTRQPLLLGGMPEFNRHRHKLAHHQFVGCIRNVLINDKVYKVDVAKAVGNVTVSACPTT